MPRPGFTASLVTASLLTAALLSACDGKDGAVTAEDCAADQIFTSQCAECGPTDGCLRTEDVCANPCDDADGACEGDGICFDGACLHGVCG